MDYNSTLQSFSHSNSNRTNFISLKHNEHGTNCLHQLKYKQNERKFGCEMQFYTDDERKRNNKKD